MIHRFITWVAARFGLVTLPMADVKAARAKLELLLQYAQQSGALNHPKRIKARGRVIATAAAVLQNLETP